MNNDVGLQIVVHPLDIFSQNEIIILRAHSRHKSAAPHLQLFEYMTAQEARPARYRDAFFLQIDMGESVAQFH